MYSTFGAPFCAHAASLKLKRIALDVGTSTYMYTVHYTCILCIVSTVHVFIIHVHIQYMYACMCLCTVGDVESTEPTKMLMRIADHVDNGRDDIRQWFLSCHGEVLDMLADEKYKEKAMDQRLAESTVLER